MSVIAVSFISAGSITDRDTDRQTERERHTHRESGNGTSSGTIELVCIISSVI